MLIVEDDPYSLVRYEGERLPSIYELAGGEGVVYSFSFSKIAAPGLRVGYLIGPADLIARIEALAVQTYLTPALLPQATAHEFVSRGLLEPNLDQGDRAATRATRRDARRARAGDARGRELEPARGRLLHVARLPRGHRHRRCHARGEEHGVTFVAGRDFFPPGKGGESSARLAYSFVSPDEISSGVARLATVLRELRSSPVAV